jgi:hypothetical protein
MKHRHIPYCCADNQQIYDEYYFNQAGNGLPVFMGTKLQRGHGIGNLLSGLFRAATPLLKKGAMALGKRALKTGMKIAGDAIQGKNIKQAAKRHLMDTGTELVTSAFHHIESPEEPQRKRSKPIRVRAPSKKAHRMKRVPVTRKQDIFD